MPLIILGLIVILGACLLIYYQLGPKVTKRLGGGIGSGSGSGGGSGGFGGLGGLGALFGMQDPNAQNPNAQGPGFSQGAGAGPGQGSAGGDGGFTANEAEPDGKTGDESDGKVLFIFGDGERVERTLDGDDDKEK